MKSLISTITVMAIITIAACKKKQEPEPLNPGNPTTGTYSSIDDFYAQNGVPVQTYIISGTSGGSFTSPQGTTVTIPANAFVTQAGSPVTGNVTIEFKDIYKKSDMLLSDKPTNTYWGEPLESGGEFFIKAISGGVPVLLANGKKISVDQPVMLTGMSDSGMAPFVLIPDSATNPGGWIMSYDDSLYQTANSYVYNIYQFAQPANSGTWSNTDNPYPFAWYAPNTLTLHLTDDPANFSVDVYLVFSGINTTVHVYGNGADFPDNYAPVGFQCTAVAVGVKGGKLYSSFSPITISANQTVNFSMTETTTTAFKAQLEALN